MKNILEYKGFIGSVEVSLEDDVLFGKVLNTNHLISYEGNTVTELKQNFKEASDNFLAFAQELGMTDAEIFNKEIIKEKDLEKFVSALEEAEKRAREISEKSNVQYTKIKKENIKNFFEK